MKLIGFRIQNFRSIIDTGWTYLSPDNITGLIGQNESGKTSMLEALNSFFSGTISEDILRSEHISLAGQPEIAQAFVAGRGFTQQGNACEIIRYRMRLPRRSHHR